jgi:hypothetical protein
MSPRIERVAGSAPDEAGGKRRQMMEGSRQMFTLSPASGRCTSQAYPVSLGDFTIRLSEPQKPMTNHAIAG